MGILVALVGWVAWFLVPRFLVAIIATALYWSTNPILCIVSWFLACIILLAKLQASEEAEEQKEEEEEAARVAAEEELAKKNTRDPGAQSGRQRRQRPTQSPGQKVQQWWDVLGVNPSASAEVIKAAYRRVAKATHPDSAPDKKGDVDTFSKANEAYQKWLKGKDK
jgi:DnaJ-domain-containing protein 1